MADRRAAIELDEVLDRPLEDLNAAEFLQVLGHPRAQFPGIHFVVDKKKWELWVDEGGFSKISLGDLFGRMTNEKKKLELVSYENPPIIGTQKPHFVGGAYAQLVEDVAALVEQRRAGS